MRNAHSKLLTVALLFMATVAAFSQQMQKSVIGSGASAAQSQGMMLAGTIGQHIIGVSGNTEQQSNAGFWYNTFMSTNDVENEKTDVKVVDNNIVVAPHPVNSVSTIHYTPSCEGMVRIELYTLVGNKIKTLYNDHAQGELQLDFDARGLASGNYSLRVTTPCGQSTALVIVKQ